jgi:hypothetical protein
MTRLIYDKFSKDFLEELLKPYGKVNPAKEIADEIRQVDVWFTPAAEQTGNIALFRIIGNSSTPSSNI